MPDGEEAPVTDRERAALQQALHRHLGEGRLDLSGFDDRVAQLYRADTRAQARAALDGLPPLDAAPERRRARRRHGESGRVEPHWVATDELFRDPSTGRIMRVWVDPTDASRHYAPADV